MLQSNCAVQEEISVPLVDIEEIDKIIGSGKINPAKPKVAVANIQKESSACRKSIGLHPSLTDWSEFDRGQIWEVYQGLVNGVDVSPFFDPKFSATEMCAMRLAAE